MATAPTMTTWSSETIEGRDRLPRSSQARSESIGSASEMPRDDHVRAVRVLAPRNPLITVATFHFVPQRSEPRVSPRIRLAQPQAVLAVAEMNDGTLLMTRTWVEVATNGCA